MRLTRKNLRLIIESYLFEEEETKKEADKKSVKKEKIYKVNNTEFKIIDSGETNDKGDKIINVFAGNEKVTNHEQVKGISYAIANNNKDLKDFATNFESIYDAGNNRNAMFRAKQYGYVS